MRSTHNLPRWRDKIQVQMPRHMGDRQRRLLVHKSHDQVCSCQSEGQKPLRKAHEKSKKGGEEKC